MHPVLPDRSIVTKIQVEVTLPIQVEWIELSFVLPARRDIDSEWKQSKWEDDQTRVLVVAGGDHPAG